MRLLHLYWNPSQSSEQWGSMVLWGEDASAPQPEKRRRTREAQPHPFACDFEVLREWLVDMGIVGIRQTLSESELTLWLPTARYGPIPSPHLPHEWEGIDTDPLDLRAFTVSGVALSVPLVFQLLMKDLEKKLEGNKDFHLGPSFRYWRKAVLLNLELLAAQKFAPAVFTSDGKKRGGYEEYYLRWIPILDAPRDALRVQQLAKSMPPVCRAQAALPRSAPSSGYLLYSFLQSMTDALVRLWARPIENLIQRHREAGIAYAWMKALVGKDSRLYGSIEQCRQIAGNHLSWMRDLYVAGDVNYRIALRLFPPAQNGTSKRYYQRNNQLWKLEFLIQLRDDPDTLIPAKQVWSHRQREFPKRNSWKSKLLEDDDGREFQPGVWREKLLTALGYISRLFPPIERALEHPKPQFVLLTAQEAYQFLKDIAPLLEESGFGVLVPEWWNKPKAKLGLRMKVSAPNEKGSVGLGLSQILHFRWEVVLGDTILSKQEFEALLSKKTPLIQLRGQWVHLDPKQVEAALKFWERESLEGEIPLQKALHLKIGEEVAVEGLEIHGVEFEGWLKDWLDNFSKNIDFELAPPPRGLRATLRHYQLAGYSWLRFMREHGFGACLADDMGLGKTLQVLAFLLKDKEDGNLLAPSLVICPTSVIHNWAKEIERFTPDLKYMIHHGPDRLKGEKFKESIGNYDVVLTSYSIVRRDTKELQDPIWHCIVLDEAQNIKNPETQQTKAIFKLKAPFRIALTGTPVENRLSELWSIMHFLNPGYLGSHSEFRRRYALPIERYGDSEVQKKLKELVGLFLLRRVKTDPKVIQDLPEKQEIKEYCTLSPEQMALYKSLVDEMVQKIEDSEGIQRKGQILALLLKLKQICNHPALYLREFQGNKIPPSLLEETERSGKVSRLLELVDEALSNNDKMLIFTQFSEMGHLLKAQLQRVFGVPVLYLYGAVPAKQREQMIHRFQQESGPPIFVLSLKAGGTGLNLTKANHVFHFDRWWNPAVEDQATDRAFRIGQTKNVLVHKFVCIGTLEEKIDAMIEDKKALAEAIVGTGEDWLTELSSDAIRQLVALREASI